MYSVVVNWLGAHSKKTPQVAWLSCHMDAVCHRLARDCPAVKADVMPVCCLGHEAGRRMFTMTRPSLEMLRGELWAFGAFACVRESAPGRLCEFRLQEPVLCETPFNVCTCVLLSVAGLCSTHCPHRRLSRCCPQSHQGPCTASARARFCTPARLAVWATCEPCFRLGNRSMRTCCPGNDPHKYLHQQPRFSQTTGGVQAAPEPCTFAPKPLACKIPHTSSSPSLSETQTHIIARSPQSLVHHSIACHHPPWLGHEQQHEGARRRRRHLLDKSPSRVHSHQSAKGRLPTTLLQLRQPSAAAQHQRCISIIATSPPCSDAAHRYSARKKRSSSSPRSSASTPASSASVMRASRCCADLSALSATCTMPCRTIDERCGSLSLSSLPSSSHHVRQRIFGDVHLRWLRCCGAHRQPRDALNDIVPALHISVRLASPHHTTRRRAPLRPRRHGGADASTGGQQELSESLSPTLACDIRFVFERGPQQREGRRLQGQMRERVHACRCVVVPSSTSCGMQRWGCCCCLGDWPFASPRLYRGRTSAPAQSEDYSSSCPDAFYDRQVRQQLI
jgi:hypothetical protein